MEKPPEWFADALASGEADRVNEAIDRIEAVETTERVGTYSDLFDACRPVYESNDGYVRQSVVRFLRDAYPRLEIRIGTSTTDAVNGHTLDDLTEHRIRLLEFLLRALDDDDGRVRRAAVDGIETLSIAMVVAELDAERRALAEQLQALSVDRPESQRKHVEQARQAVDRGPEVASILSGIEIPEDVLDDNQE